MAGGEFAERLRRLEPDILKYMSKEVFDGRLNLIRETEEKYKGEALRCELPMVSHGVHLAYHIIDISEHVYEACVERAIREGTDLEICKNIRKEISEIAESAIGKMEEDLGKCGCKFTIYVK
jgi:hypothetical protein